MKQLQPDLFIPDNFKEEHSYYADEKGEKEYTGITTILHTLAKPALIGWAANMAVESVAKAIEGYRVDDENYKFSYELRDAFLAEAKSAHRKKKEAAGEHGTNMHEIAEKWIKNCIEQNLIISFGFSAETNKYYEPIAQFVHWAEDNVDHFLFSERPVHSRTLFLAGTTDAGAVMKDGTRRVIDIKTGSGIYYEAILQCEFYQLLAEEEGDERYDGAVIVNMRKDGGFETQVRARSDIDQDAALGLLAAYRGAATFITKK